MGADRLGRWVVWINRHGNLCDSDRHDAQPVPAVPCDEAAISRGARAIYERLNPPGSPPAIFGATWYRETAEAVLRAAGGQDEV